MRKKVWTLIGALAAGAVGWNIGRCIGHWYEGVLRGTDGIITATALMQCRFGIPLVCAFLPMYLIYILTRDE